MPSAFSWLDFSERDRRRVLDVVRALGEGDTRDELGLATVRDALADLLAPGVSTIQTRARYFFFVPWMYLELEDWLRRTSARIDEQRVTREARKVEIALIEQLLEVPGEYGIIGRLAEKDLQRLPSSIYWNGMGELGIRLCPLAVGGYHRRLAVHGPPPKRGAEGEPSRPNWHPGLPAAPEGFPEGATMQLRPVEAEYLCERIVENHPNSLVGRLALEPTTAVDELAYPWELIDRMELPADVAEVVVHAREFSLAMHGPVLIYNLMLAEAQKEPRDDWRERYVGLIEAWAAELSGQFEEFSRWDRSHFWRTVARTRKIPLRTQRFVDAWLDRLAGARDFRALAHEPGVHRLIADRERELKKRQARLTNPRRLESWNGAAGVGVGRLNYRWPVVRSHIVDIRTGLEEERAVA